METATYIADGSWVCPAGVTEVTVEAIQAGSSGEGGSFLGPGGGGGAEGTYARKKVAVVPGQTYNIVVGEQTASVPYNTVAVGIVGEASIFYDTDGTTELCAARGSSSASARFGGVSSTTGSVGDSIQAGASGADAANTTSSVGGVGGGPTAITGSPTGLTRGAGGIGGTTGTPAGGGGTAPGGGGGGGRGNVTLANGGPGARGTVVLSWTSGIRWS